MKRFLEKHRLTFLIILLLFLWRIYLLFIETLRFSFPVRVGYLGFIARGNFDGVYYLTIAQYGYRGLDQAFFPFYPILVGLVQRVFYVQAAAAGVVVSVIALFFFLKTLCLLMELDGMKKYAFWTLFLYLSFPTAFFLTAIYTESLFLLLVLLSFYFARTKKIYLASIAGAFASATRIIGIFLLPALFLELYLELRKKKGKKSKKFLISYFLPLLFIPVGLVSYMAFLWYKYGDPLLFVHIQPSFGAGRSGGKIILLPQVIYRYIKIFFTVPVNSLTFWTAVLESSALILGCLCLYLAYRKGIRKSYILFAACALLFPTLSGTLSSLPRYILVCFAIFIYLGSLKNKFIKTTLIILGLVLQAILAILFFQGYFIS